MNLYFWPVLILESLNFVQLWHVILWIVYIIWIVNKCIAFYLKSSSCELIRFISHTKWYFTSVNYAFKYINAVIFSGFTKFWHVLNKLLHNGLTWWSTPHPTICPNSKTLKYQVSFFSWVAFWKFYINNTFVHVWNNSVQYEI